MNKDEEKKKEKLVVFYSQRSKKTGKREKKKHRMNEIYTSAYESFHLFQLDHVSKTSIIIIVVINFIIGTNTCEELRMS